MTEPMTVVDVLREARARIADPGRWTKGAMARRTGGRPASTGSTTVCQWCLVGACLVVTPDRLWPSARNLLNDVARLEGYSSAAGFNDAPETSHADVLAFYDRAIAITEKQEAAA